MEVEEYTELDFEHVTLETVPVAVCEACNTEHLHIMAGIWQCEICGEINHKDL